MKRKKLVLIIVCLVLLCLVVLREIGVVDIHLYKSMLSTSHSTTKSQENRGQEKNFSYHLVLKYKKEMLDSHFLQYKNLPPIEIEAILEEPVYSGNYGLPLAKNFKMTYQCEFKTTKSSSGTKVQGKITGEVNAKIRGLCSRIKAKKLAFEEAKKQISSYFRKQLNP